MMRIRGFATSYDKKHSKVKLNKQYFESISRNLLRWLETIEKMANKHVYIGTQSIIDDNEFNEEIRRTVDEGTQADVAYNDEKDFFSKTHRSRTHLKIHPLHFPFSVVNLGPELVVLPFG